MDKRCICVISPYIEGFYYGVLLKNIHQEIYSNNMRMLVIQTNFLNENNLNIYYKLASDYIDGYIVLPNAISNDYFQYLLSQQKPIVMIGQDFESDQCHYVTSDNVGGARSAVEHLIHHGHKNIAFIGDFHHYDIRERHKGYKIALEQGHIPYDEHLIGKTEDTLPLDGKLAIEKIIKSGAKITAAVCANDYLAQGVVEGLIENGYKVPEDVAVFGYDDSDCAKENSPPLSSVAQDIPGLGKTAASTIINLIKGKKIPTGTIYLTSSIVTRLSCNCGEAIEDTFFKTENEIRSLKKIIRYMEHIMDVYIRTGKQMAKLNLEEIKDYTWLVSLNSKCGCLGLVNVEEDNLNVQRVYYPSKGDPQKINCSCSPECFPPESYTFNSPCIDDKDIIWIHIIRSDNFEWGTLATVGPFNEMTCLYNFNNSVYGFETIIFSISREAYREKMILKEGHLRSLLDNAGQGFLTINENLFVDEEYSSACIDVFQKEIGNHFFPELIHPQDIEARTFLCDVLKNALNPKNEKNASVYFDTLSGLIEINQKKVHIEYKLISDTSKKKKIMIILTDVTEKSKLMESIEELKDYNVKLNTLSQTDELTGLYNRRGFLNLSHEAIKLAQHNGSAGIIFFADMDGLKRINDTFGHGEGDIAIKEMANILKKSFRSGDIIARIGGDEFSIFTLNTSEESIEKARNRINYHCDLFNKNSNKPYQLSITIGAIKYDSNSPIIVEQLMMQADELLYDSKRNKKQISY